MTRALQDVRRQPSELTGVLDRLTSGEAAAIHAAAATLDLSRPLYLVGSGSSYNIAIAASILFQAGGIAAIPMDASEFLHFVTIPRGSNVILLSRSGKSIEIVRLMDKLGAAGARTIGITNTPDSPLGRGCDVLVDLGAAFDFNVSFTMYAALGLAAGLIAEVTRGTDLPSLANDLRRALAEAESRLDGWQAQIEASAWVAEAPTYFLARGSSLASANEARLLWEEVAKFPASALPTGGFRHGSQEAVAKGLRIGLWLDPSVLRGGDLQLAKDLQAAGAEVLCIGAGLTGAEATLALDVPTTPSGWQFLVDASPVQLASLDFARRRGADPDTFRFCSFIVEGEAGLGAKAPVAA